MPRCKLKLSPRFIRSKDGFSVVYFAQALWNMQTPTSVKTRQRRMFRSRPAQWKLLFFCTGGGPAAPKFARTRSSSHEESTSPWRTALVPELHGLLVSVPRAAFSCVCLTPI